MPNVDNTQGLINEGVAIDYEPATSSVADATEDFVLDLNDVGDHRQAIIVKNGAGHGAVTIAAPLGDFWFSKGDPLALSVADGATEIVYIESAKYKKTAGTITLTATPAAGKRLLTDHAFAVAVVNEPIAN